MPLWKTPPCQRLLLRNPRVKEAVDRALTRAKKQSPSPEDKKDTSETDTESMDGTFAISTFTTSPEQEGAYALHDSFILDSASTIHV